MTDFSSQHDMLNRLLGIQEIDVLQLNSPNYTRNLNENLKALRENIDKILSVPFLQGAKGDSVEIGDFPLFTISRIRPESTNSNYVLTPTDFNYTPTIIGQEILKVLFPLAFPNDSDIPGVNWREVIDGYNGDQYIGVPEYRQVIENTGYHAYDNLFKDFSEDHTDGDLIIEWNNLTQEQQQEYNDILDYIVQNSWVPSTITVSLYYSIKNPAFNYNISDTSTWYNIDILQSASYFVFYDYRLKDISSGNDSQEYFKDTSAAIFRERIEDDYKFVNKNLLPTVYYNFSLHMFCWCINGIETNIICEGIPGRDGDSMVARLVKVDTSREIDLTGSVHGYYITQILNTEETPIGWIPEEIESTQPEDFNDLFNNGQMAIAFGNAIGSSTDQDIFFGIIRKYHDYNSDNEYWLCYMNTDVSVLSVAGDISALNIFNNLGSDTSVRGLYVRDAGWRDNLPNTQFCHILYSDDANSFKLCPCNPEFAETGEGDPGSFSKTLKVDYRNISIFEESMDLKVLKGNNTNRVTFGLSIDYNSGSPFSTLYYSRKILGIISKKYFSVTNSYVDMGVTYPLLGIPNSHIQIVEKTEDIDNEITIEGNTIIKTRDINQSFISYISLTDNIIDIKKAVQLFSGNIPSQMIFSNSGLSLSSYTRSSRFTLSDLYSNISLSEDKINILSRSSSQIVGVEPIESSINLSNNKIEIKSNGEIVLNHVLDSSTVGVEPKLSMSSTGISIDSSIDINFGSNHFANLISFFENINDITRNIITICSNNYTISEQVPFTGIYVNELPITFNSGQSIQKICLTYHPLAGLNVLPYKIVSTHPSLIIHNGLDNVTLPIAYNDPGGQDVMTRIAFSSNKQTSSNENYLVYLVLTNPRPVGDSPDNYVWRYDVCAETATYNYNEVPLTYQTDPTNNNSGDSIFGGGRFNHLNEIASTAAQVIADFGGGPN